MISEMRKEFSIQGREISARGAPGTKRLLARIQQISWSSLVPQASFYLIYSHDTCLQALDINLKLNILVRDLAWILL